MFGLPSQALAWYCMTPTTQDMEALMVQYIRTVAFLKHLFDKEGMADKAARIVEGILAARSPRLSAIAQHMPGNPAANYKAIQRFLAQADPQTALLRLFQADAPFRHRGPHRNAAAPGSPDPLCGYAEGWQDPGLLVAPLSHPPSGAGPSPAASSPTPLGLLRPDVRFPQPISLAGF
jgi:hypothetical protein